MPIDPDTQLRERKSLAEALRGLRRASGLSGERLALRCNMSQTKISRIETGRALPTVIDVDRILKALAVPDEVADEILRMARRANVSYASWRTYARVGLYRKQLELGSLESSSRVVRHFLPAVPTGLLHVREYATETLSPTVPGEPTRDVEKAVEARTRRQTILDDTSRTFWFLMTEQAVMWRRAGNDVMAAQCAHMAEVNRRPNVEIGVIPQTAHVPGTPMNIFVIYDDRLVTVELFSGEVTLRDPKDVTQHQNLFELFWSHALTGENASEFLSAASHSFMHQRD
ncbi:helix-turn-helix transcriptional regulator [Streptomyces sp. AM 4-1-1]|uniref:helix-turn-helix domain-containing protein n=1 Tax=unclassified Streptomyces TaxID=2593676 RepID=UPI0023BA2DF7|nr:helix-turn-helix transcriptional regulator [Streptomyces sp. AM 4-1-1]WEH33504.1 helix-turn-helix transcriptional regulator [Streptomyces sp. AM 4-1-1]